MLRLGRGHVVRPAAHRDCAQGEVIRAGRRAQHGLITGAEQPRDETVAAIGHGGRDAEPACVRINVPGVHCEVGLGRAGRRLPQRHRRAIFTQHLDESRVVGRRLSGRLPEKAHLAQIAGDSGLIIGAVPRKRRPSPRSTGVRVRSAAAPDRAGCSAGATSSRNRGTGVSVGLPSAALASRGVRCPFGRTNSSTV